MYRTSIASFQCDARHFDQVANRVFLLGSRESRHHFD